MGKQVLFKLLFITGLLTFSSSLCTVSAQSWLWGRQPVPSNAALGEVPTDHPVAVDANGDAFMTGFFTGSLTFGTNTINAFDESMYLVKYDSYGNALWARQATLASNLNSSAVSNSVAVDDSGNTYVTGYFSDTIFFGTHRLVNQSTNNGLFIVKYDPNGNVKWAKQSVQASAASDAEGSSIAVDGSGNCYVTGYVEDTVSFGAFTLISSPAQDLLLAKYDLNGNVLWVKQATQANAVSLANGYSIALDNADNIFVTGVITDTVSIGTFKLTTVSPTLVQFFLAKYDVNGNALWAEQDMPASSASFAGGVSVAVEASGDAYVAGYFKDTVTIGTNKLIQSNFKPDLFLAKYDKNGNVIWLKQGMPLDVNTWSPYSVVCDTLKQGGGFLVMEGDNFPPYKLRFSNDTFELNTNKASATILMQFDSSGSVMCGSMFTEGDEDDGDGVGVDKSGQYIYLSGDLDDTTIFANDTLPYGGDMSFIARWQSCNCQALVTACCNTTIAPGSSTLLNCTYEKTYSWTPVATLNCNTCESPLATPNVTTTYYVSVTDFNGCHATDSVTIIVAEPEICDDIFVPTAFSPNGDGQNDRLYVMGNCISTFEFDIFDRWGNRVFETESISNPWDGTYKGEPLNTGTYVYYLTATLNDGTQVNKQGNITLVR